MTKALKNFPKSNKSPNLVTLLERINHFKLVDNHLVNPPSQSVKLHLNWVWFYEQQWSSGYGRRLKFYRLWVWIPGPYTRWTFFHINLWQKLKYLFEKGQKNQKEAGIALLKKQGSNHNWDRLVLTWNDMQRFYNFYFLN